MHTAISRSQQFLSTHIITAHSHPPARKTLLPHDSRSHPYNHQIIFLLQGAHKPGRLKSRPQKSATKKIDLSSRDFLCTIFHETGIQAQQAFKPSLFNGQPKSLIDPIPQYSKSIQPIPKSTTCSRRSRISRTLPIAHDEQPSEWHAVCSPQRHAPYNRRKMPHNSQKQLESPPQGVEFKTHPKAIK